MTLCFSSNQCSSLLRLGPRSFLSLRLGSESAALSPPCRGSRGSPLLPCLVDNRPSHFSLSRAAVRVLFLALTLDSKRPVRNFSFPAVACRVLLPFPQDGRPPPTSGASRRTQNDRNPNWMKSRSPLPPLSPVGVTCATPSP